MTFQNLTNLYEVIKTLKFELKKSPEILEKEEEVKIKEVFKEFSPINDYSDKKFQLDFTSFSLGVPKFDEEYSKVNKLTNKMITEIKKRIQNKFNNKINIIALIIISLIGFNACENKSDGILMDKDNKVLLKVERI
jgi:hypothetical protein